MVVPGSYPRRQRAKFLFRGVLFIIIMLRSGNAYVSFLPRAARRLCNTSRRSSRSRNLRRKTFHRRQQGTVYHVGTSNAATTSRLKASAADSPISTSATDPAAPSLKRYHDLSNRVDRVFCLSDLHTDHVDNLRWLRHRLTKQLSSSAAATTTTKLNERDLVIVAGDISHDVPTFRESLDLLLEHCQVLFVPGNHEAWLSHKERQLHALSLDKLDYFYQLCRERGAYVDPVYMAGCNGGDKDGVPPLWILPLESWYDGSLSFDEELCQGFEYWPWVDFARTRWPFPLEPMDSPNARIPVGLVEHFLNRNRVNILDPWRELYLQQVNNNPQKPFATVITVSHFASSQQCLPDWIDLHATEFRSHWLDHGAGAMSAKFAKVAGTAKLDEQLRALLLPESPSISLTRQIHVFGHSHRPKDFEFRGIRYIHNPLGKPRERQLHMVSPDVDFQCLWNRAQHGSGEVPGETILRYWEERGGGKEMLWKRMEQVRPGRYQREPKRSEQRRKHRR